MARTANRTALNRDAASFAPSGTTRPQNASCRSATAAEEGLRAAWHLPAWPTLQCAAVAKPGAGRGPVPLPETADAPSRAGTPGDRFPVWFLPGGQLLRA